MLKTSVARLRVVGMLEAVSFLVLLTIAMPLKYLGGLPVAVQIAGWVHGLLFLAFCMVLLQTHQSEGWPKRWTAVVLIAGLLPLGPFVIDRRLRERDKSAGSGQG
jgi:integral membrane protein